MLDSKYDGLVRMDGFDDCVLGICSMFGSVDRIAYSIPAILRKLEAQGMSETQAIEFYEYNQLGSYVGEATPCFIDVDR